MDKTTLLFQVSADDFKKIPGSPIAYWAPFPITSAFERKQFLGNYSSVKIGMGTGKNDVFVRNWWEVSNMKIDFSLTSIEQLSSTPCKYFPYNKGGEFRLWYGNSQTVLWFDEDGRKYMNTMSGHRENGGYNFYFRHGLTWSFISASKFGIRSIPDGFLFDVAGSTLFVDDTHSEYFLGFLISVVSYHILKLLNPTVNFQAGNIKNLPILFGKQQDITEIVKECVSISKLDWDSYETSWDFQENPLIDAVRHNDKSKMLSNLYGQVRASWEQQCETMRKLEVENNRIFIEIYGLQDELSPDVPWDEITLTCNPWYRYGKSPELDSDGQHFSTTGELKVGTIFGMQPTGIKVSEPNQEMKVTSFPFNQELEDRLQKDTVKELISYAVGCMFGRYSLDVPGLAFAGGEWDTSKYDTFPADDDNIIPICDDEYFEDDLSSRFVSFIETVFGTESLEENLNFIAKALGGRGSSREVIRKYFREDFFADHCKMYQKRPIYWLFDSGKKGGFRALIYMHRYQPDTLARLRTDYVHEQQERYRTAMADLTLRMDKASASEKIKLEKQLRAFREQAEETRLYEEKIHHLADKMISIDLDDGVKHNYAIFQDVLAKIK